MRRLAIGALCVLLLAGCAGAPSSPAAAEPNVPSQALTIKVGGGVRRYRRYRPTSIPAQSRPPVVVVLHGASVSPEQTERYYHWDAAADAHGFVVVYPQGIGNAWNAGSCCGDAPAAGTDDVGFLSALLPAVVADERADPDRVFLTDVSNGAMLTYEFACQHPGVVAAVGIVAGALTSPCDSPPPVPLIAIHGLADRVVVFAPGPGSVDSGPDLRLSALKSVERWRAADGCAEPVTVTSGKVHTETSKCRPGFDVVLVTIDGAGHQWPGAVLDAARLRRDGRANQPSDALDATGTLWAFFTTHHRG